MALVLINNILTHLVKDKVLEGSTAGLSAEAHDVTIRSNTPVAAWLRLYPKNLCGVLIINM